MFLGQQRCLHGHLKHMLCLLNPIHFTASWKFLFLVEIQFCFLLREVRPTFDFPCLAYIISKMCYAQESFKIIQWCFSRSHTFLGLLKFSPTFYPFAKSVLIWLSPDHFYRTLSMPLQPLLQGNANSIWSSFSTAEPMHLQIILFASEWATVCNDFLFCGPYTLDISFLNLIMYLHNLKYTTQVTPLGIQFHGLNHMPEHDGKAFGWGVVYSGYRITFECEYTIRSLSVWGFRSDVYFDITACCLASQLTFRGNIAFVLRVTDKAKG
jgi:hypothetical protein